MESIHKLLRRSTSTGKEFINILRALAWVVLLTATGDTQVLQKARVTMTGILKKMLTAAGMTAALMLAATPAHAVYNIVLTESGGNVVATGSGSINTAGVAVVISTSHCGLDSGAVAPFNGTLCTGSGAPGKFVPASGPSNFGTGVSTDASSSSGQPVFFDSTAIVVPAAYVSGSAISNTTTWNATTFAALHITVGTYTWTWGSGADADSAVLYVRATPPAAATVTPGPIPGYLALPGVPGIFSKLAVLDMSSGSGPSMTTCLLNTIKQMFGTDATYLGQSSNGAARISVGAQTISFYPLAASTSTAMGIGVFATGNNSLNIGTSCGTFNVVPALANMADFGTALNANGLGALIDANGVINVAVGGNLYVVRPDYFVTPGAATGTPRIAFGTDGVLRFSDSAGNVQILRPAFLDPSALQNAMSNAFSGALSIQADGSGVFTLINGSQLLLAPEMVLTPAPQGLGSANWVNDKVNHFLYRIAAYDQGLAVTARP